MGSGERASSVRMKTDRFHVKSNLAIIFLLYFNLNSNIDMNIFKYKYEMDVLDSDFYSNIYSIQLKVHTVKLNSRYMNNLQYQSEINYNR